MHFLWICLQGQLHNTRCVSVCFMIGRKIIDVLTATIAKTISVCCATNTRSQWQYATKLVSRKTDYCNSATKVSPLQIERSYCSILHPCTMCSALKMYVLRLPKRVLQRVRFGASSTSLEIIQQLLTFSFSSSRPLGPCRKTRCVMIVLLIRLFVLHLLFCRVL